MVSFVVVHIVVTRAQARPLLGQPNHDLQRWASRLYIGRRQTAASPSSHRGGTKESPNKGKARLPCWRLVGDSYAAHLEGTSVPRGSSGVICKGKSSAVSGAASPYAATERARVLLVDFLLGGSGGSAHVGGGAGGGPSTSCGMLRR